jgi:hypothetical protein
VGKVKDKILEAEEAGIDTEDMSLENILIVLKDIKVSVAGVEKMVKKAVLNESN